MTRRLLTSLVVGLAAANAATGTTPVRPRLVVGIMVDQLRTDYIDYLRDLFGEKGFNRLLNNGVYFKDVDFKAPVKDAAAGTALIYSGTYPSINGIPGAKVYDPEKKELRSPLHDPNALGNFTDETYSPVGLRVSTLADELAVDGAGLGYIFSLAPDPEQAIIMAGHAGSSAFWIDSNSGKWSSTTYYRENPKTIRNRNTNASISSRLDTLQWRPLLPLEKYPALPAQKKFFPFSYRFPKGDRNVFSRFKDSPLVNTEVTDVAIDYLNTLKLGNRGDVIDMLNVAYTAEPWAYTADGDSRLELEDTYLRLDRQIGRLLEAIDSGVGLHNTVIFLSSTGYYADPSSYDEKYNLPGGTFSTKRATSLLNAYLSAKHGGGQYVKAMHEGGIYLDHATLEQHQTDPAEAAREARDFLCRMAGVAEARTYREILAAASPETEARRLSLDPRTAADLYLSFTPGWNVVDDLKYPPSSSMTRDMAVNTPAIIMAPGVEKKQTVSSPVDAAAIAPTLAGLIRIRAPNGASTRPLLLR